MFLWDLLLGKRRLGLTSITEQMNSSFGGSKVCKQLFIDCEKYFKTPKRDGYHYNYNNMIWHIRRVVFTCRDHPSALTKKELENVKKDIRYLLEDIKLFFLREIEFDTSIEKEYMTFYEHLDEYLHNVYNLRASLEQENVK